MDDTHSSMEKPVCEWGEIEVERLGGFAGYGAPGALLRCFCQFMAYDLSLADQATLQDLFLRPRKPSSHERDAFRYRLTRKIEKGEHTVVVGENDVPEAIRSCMRDEIMPR